MRCHGLCVQAVCRNGLPYSLSSAEDVQLTVEVEGESVPFSKELAAKPLPSVSDVDDVQASPSIEDTNDSVKVTFFTRRAGEYVVTAWINGLLVGNSPQSQVVEASEYFFLNVLFEACSLV